MRGRQPRVLQINHSLTLGDPHGASSKEPWGSKEHNLKTPLPVSLEWQGDV